MRKKYLAIFFGAGIGLTFLSVLALILAINFAPKPSLYGTATFSRVLEDSRGEVLRITLSEDEKYRIFTPLREIPTELQSATLLYEDRKFYSHYGVNPLALMRSGWNMLTGSRRMGGSTITMQLVRLTNNMDTTSIPGKLRQIFAALVLEQHYAKTEILEAYFNLAPYGANVEGVGAAARVWFHKKPQNLNLTECLALVSIPQNPSVRGLHRATGNSALEDARARLGSIWEEAVEKAKNEDPTRAALYALPLKVYTTADMPFLAPHAVNSVLPLIQNAPAASRAFSPSGPFRLTLDMRVQRLVEKRLHQNIARSVNWGMRNACVVLVENSTSHIKALVGSADFWDASIKGQVDGTLAPRSPASTLKPFIYALALEQGLITPATILSDSPHGFGAYMPENSDGTFAGPISATEALQRSRNIPAISLANRLKNPDLYSFLQKGGIAFPRPLSHYGLSLVLGGAEVRPRELAGLYSALANYGLWQPPILYMPARQTVPVSLLSPEAAYITLSMLQNPAPGVYVKTGTSNGYKDAWAAGIVGPYTLIAWVGNFDGSPNQAFTGQGAAVPLFLDIASSLASFKRWDSAALMEQRREGLNLARIPICTATGEPVQENEPCISRTGRSNAIVSTWYIPGISPVRGKGEANTLRLISPRENMAYQARIAEAASIPLRVEKKEGDESPIFWFIDERFLGSALPGEILLWEATAGTWTVRAVSQDGRNATATVIVQSLP